MTDTGTALSVSPAEATVLLSPNSGAGFAAIKATLLLLLTTGVLHVEESEEPGFFRSKKVAHLRIAAEPKNASPEITAVLDLVRAAQPGGKIKDVVKLAEKTFGARCAKYNAKYIVPALVARGLLEEKKILFVRSFHATAEGAKVQARIKSDLFRANDAARLLKSDPAQAAAIAASLGTTILLCDKLTKQFKPLADAMRQRGEGGDVTVFTGDGVHHAGGPGGFDFGSFDIGSFDAAAADALHAGISAFEGGFSDAGGGHHGDSGGGGGHH